MTSTGFISHHAVTLTASLHIFISVPYHDIIIYGDKNRMSSADYVFPHHVGLGIFNLTVMYGVFPHYYVY